MIELATLGYTYHHLFWRKHGEYPSIVMTKDEISLGKARAIFYTIHKMWDNHITAPKIDRYSGLPNNQWPSDEEALIAEQYGEYDEYYYYKCNND